MAQQVTVRQRVGGGLCLPHGIWLPGGAAKAWFSGGAAGAAEGATHFCTLIPSLITRSYMGACASHQPNHAGSCLQKTAPYQKFRQSLQKMLVGGSSPCPLKTMLATIMASPCKQSVMALGFAKGFLKPV